MKNSELGIGVPLLIFSFAALGVLVSGKIALEILIAILSIFLGWSLLKNAENPTETKFIKLNRTLLTLIIILVIIIYHRHGIKPALGMIYTAAYLSGPAAFGWFLAFKTRYKIKKKGAKLAAKYQKLFLFIITFDLILGIYHSSGSWLLTLAIPIGILSGSYLTLWGLEKTDTPQS